MATTLLLLALIGTDLKLDRGDGILLFSALLLYLGYLFIHRKVMPRSEAALLRLIRFDEAPGTVPRNGLVLLMALILIVISAHLLINAASASAKGFGVSEWAIGVTIVAAGTSAPEFATALVDVLKGSYGLSAGAVIGSDIYNLLGVLGLAGMLHPVGVDAIARTSLGAISAMVLIVFLFMWSGWRVSRTEGFILLAIALTRWGLDFAARTP